MYRFIDFYDLLGINADASNEEVIAAFDKEAREWHPRRYPGIDGRKVMQLLIDARRVLLDYSLRDSYDREYHWLRRKNRLPGSIAKVADAVNESLPDGTESKYHESRPYATKGIFTYKRYYYVYAIGQKTDDELIYLCANAYDYPYRYIRQVEFELMKRNYDRAFIDELKLSKVRDSVITS